MCRARELFWIAVIVTAGCTEKEPTSDPADPPGTAGAPTGHAGEGGAAQGAAGTGDASQAPQKPTSNTDAAVKPGSTIDGAIGAAGDAAADAAVSPDAGVSPDAAVSPDAGPSAPAAPVFELPPLTTARLQTLVAPAQLGISERAAFIDDGRFFVAGGEGLYEIVGGPDTYSAVLLIPGPGCLLGGLAARGARLYAPCTSTSTFSVDLIVFEPSRDDPLVGRAPIATMAGAHFNGVDFGPDGALYLSNSLAVDSPDPAVVRLDILDEEPLMFTQTPFVSATAAGAPANTGGGPFPNGVRFHDDTMYLVRGPDIVAVPVGLDQPGASLEVAYTADGEYPDVDIDDFDIGDERLWLTEFSSERVFGLPGDSKMIVADFAGNVLFAIDLPFVPSSTVFVGEHTLFGPPCIILTSFFNGGLYRVTFE